MQSMAMGANGLPALRRKPAEQVAAVCYRASHAGIEFLLVQTGGGRWTFPKGNAEPGLSGAQSAALEAFEEAGVHGRIEESAFARYTFHKKRSQGTQPVQIYAYLCEVTRLEAPQELKRNPTWFSAGMAKQKLREHRRAARGAELARVIDCAADRIEQVRRRSSAAFAPAGKDALQKVPFEAGETAEHVARLQAAAFVRRRAAEPSMRRIVVDARREFLRLSAAPELAPQVHAPQVNDEWDNAQAKLMSPARKSAPKQLPN